MSYITEKMSNNKLWYGNDNSVVFMKIYEFLKLTLLFCGDVILCMLVVRLRFKFFVNLWDSFWDKNYERIEK